MTEENTFAVFPQKVFAKDVAVNDYLMIYGIPCWTARIRSGDNGSLLIEGYGVYTRTYHEKAFHPDEEIEVPVVIRADIPLYPDF